MGGILRKPIDVDAVKSKLKDLVPQNHKQPLKKSPQISRLFRERLASLYALNNESQNILAGKTDSNKPKDSASSRRDFLKNLGGAAALTVRCAEAER